MSQATEIAEREATEAEAEIAAEMTPDGDGEPEPEPTEPEPEPAEPEGEPAEADAKSSETIAKEKDKKLTSETTRHENALAKIHGDAWVDYNMCPLCIGDGFILPTPAGAMPDPQWEVIQAYAGKIGDRPLKTASWTRVCDDCEGWGVVLTGGRSEHQIEVICKRCEGRGWFDTDTEAQAQRLGTNLPPAPVYPIFHQPDAQVTHNQTPLDQPPDGWHTGPKHGADSWGRWPGHSRYGIDPAVSGGVW